MLIELRFPYAYFVIIHFYDLYHNDLLYSKALVSVGDLVPPAAVTHKNPLPDDYYLFFIVC